MRYLERERATVRKILHGLDEKLETTPLMELERPGGPGIAAFRACGGPGLLVPTAHGGSGANAVEAIRVQRAIGARSPSLAVATAMHHFSLASIVALSEVSNGFEWMLMEAVATGGKLLASGFAEGNPDVGILHPTMTATVTPEGVRVSGVKRPCSLSRSMDLLTASVMVPRQDGEGGQLAVVMIPAGTPGLTVSPFWGTFALAGTESDQVTIDDVLVPHDLVVRTDVSGGQSLGEVQIIGFLWFELLISASYLGAVSALVERALHNERIPAADRVRLVTETEPAMAALENIARQLPQAGGDARLLADSLLVRYAVQDAVGRAAQRAVELLGGVNFIGTDEVAYLAACVNALGFHPPTRGKMSGPLARYLVGESLTIA
ncbi:MAG TPA: acyl-CoA dehydrogenase family protein [Micromonosporaceae bacterium]|nr:acyl-CoA dehydrogenase family protein [Micromonosporaceae bacterium]